MACPGPWGPGGSEGGVVVALGVPDGRLRELWGIVERAGVVRCEYCMDYEDDLPVHVARQPRRPLPEVWDGLKHYE